MTNIIPTTRQIHGHSVRGIATGAQTRCAHWHSPLDVILIDRERTLYGPAGSAPASGY